MSHQTPARPYWHADAKWVCGLLFFFAFTATLFTNALTVLTQRDIAVPIASAVLSNVLTRASEESSAMGNLDEDIAEIKKKIAESGTGKFQPFPGQPVYITEQDINTLTPEQIKEKLFTELTGRYYDLGVVEMVNTATADPAEREKLLRQSSYLKYVSESAHDKLADFTKLLALVSLIPLLGLIFFSYRWGRLISPGLILFLVSTPAAILLFIISRTAAAVQQSEGPLSMIPVETGKRIAEALLPSFGIPALVGAALLIVGFLARKITHRSEPVIFAEVPDNSPKKD